MYLATNLQSPLPSGLIYKHIHEIAHTLGGNRHTHTLKHTHVVIPMRWQSRAKRLNGLIACTRCLFNSYEHTREPPHTVALKRLFCFEYFGLHKHGTNRPLSAPLTCDLASSNTYVHKTTRCKGEQWRLWGRGRGGGGTGKL